MTRLAVTDHIFADLEQEHAAAAALGVELEVHHVDDEAGTLAALRGVDVALVNFAPVTEAVLAAMAPGAVVVRYGIGTDNVDLDAARRLGVRVCNVPDYGADTVADHAVTLALLLLRKVVLFDRALSGGEWISPPALAPILASRETTVGLLGLGRIAQGVAARLAPFGFTTIAHDPFADPAAAAAAGTELVGLDELFSRSHLLSLHAPATAETHHVVDAARIASMPRGAFVVNTARGPLVDHDALLDALRSGQLGGVGLDVFDPEPLPADHPLRAEPTAVLTPHAAFYSGQSLRALQRLACEEALRAARGEPLRCPVTSPGTTTPDDQGGPA